MQSTVLNVMQFIGVLIPLSGVAILLQQEQNKISTYLMMTNIGCLIMNITQMFVFNSDTFGGALVAYKIGHLGGSWFFFSFGLFVTSYLSKKKSAWMFILWGMIEISSMAALLIAPFNKYLFTIHYQQPVQGSYSQTIRIEPEMLYYIRYSTLAFVLMIALGLTLHHMFSAKTKLIRKKLARLSGAEFVLLSTFVVSLTTNLSYDIVPVAASFSIITIILSVMRGDFFGLKEWGRNWAFEQMSEAVVIVDQEYKFLDANSYAKELFPELNEQGREKKISDNILNIFETDKKEGMLNDKHYEKKVTRIYQNGEVVGYSLLMVDISEQKKLMSQLEEEKTRADKANQAKSAFMSTMSHEIRTPMNAIVGMTEILLRSDLSGKEAEYLYNIKNSGNALLTIINDILDFSKIESGKMDIICEEYEPMSMFSDLSMIFLNRIGNKDIELIFDIDKNLPVKLHGDSLRLRQIIINLMNNAVKFTDVGRVKLTVCVENIHDDLVVLNFCVTDSGQGIKEEDIDKLFSYYSQGDVEKNRYKEGTGLGLSISKQLVEMMGGTIGVKSEYGKGSEFYFTLAQRIIDARTVEEMEQTLNGKKSAYISETAEVINFIAPRANILIVDDNQMNLKVATGLLEPLQMKMNTAENGKQAIAMMEQKKYDLVFMDHMMPIMDGIEATIAIRAMNDEYYKNVPIIALTANAVVEARARFIEVGMNDFLSKPIKMKEICAVLKKWLPKEYIEITRVLVEQETKDLPRIDGLDVEEGVKNSGNLKLFESLLGDFYKLIDLKSTKIEKCLADGLVKDYTIEVHALKNTARMIGAMELSELFHQLELYGEEGDLDILEQLTPQVLTLYRSYKPALEPYARIDNAEKEHFSNEEIKERLMQLKDAMDTFDVDQADEIMQELEMVEMPPNCVTMFNELRAYVADVAMEDVIRIAEAMIELL